MLSYLYSTIFPKLGEIFGMLVGVANMPFSLFLDMLGGDALGLFTYTNLFTGVREVSRFSLGFLGDIYGFISRLFLTDAVILQPTWVALLYQSFTIYIGIALFKFIKGLI